MLGLLHKALAGLLPGVIAIDLTPLCEEDLRGLVGVVLDAV